VSPLPTGREYFGRWLALTCVTSLVSVAILVLYLHALLRLPPEQMRGFVEIIAACFALLLLLGGLTNRRLLSPLMRSLDGQAAGTLDAAGVRRGFAAAANVPALAFVSGMTLWLVGGLLVASAMRLRFGAAFPLFSWSTMVAAAVSGGLISMIVDFYLLKRMARPMCEAFGAQLADPAERRALVRRIPLGRKLLVTVAGVMVVAMLFAILMAQVRAHQALEALANRLQVALLERAAAEMGASGRLPEGGGSAEADVLGARFVLLDPGAERVVAGARDALLESEVRAMRSAAAGQSSAFDSPNAFAWRRLEDGRGVLAVVADPRAVAGDASRVWSVLAVYAVLSLLVAVGVARLAAADIGSMTDALAREIGRVASGDLTRGQVHESEDELGELAHGLERMASTLQGTVAGVVAAAAGVEQTASQIASVGGDLAGVTADQVQGLERVTESMGRIRGEVGGIADSAHALSMSVEESSSSILELGVTGDELNQNALALTERVSEVSGSIEQMMRSARQVLADIEELAAASAETSSSMEEMAISMREVDLNASETARLSQNMVEIADNGRQQVDETIRGMEDIQQATDTAQQVIHGLGERAGEIGTILNVIDDVAEETNLLALNAAIIAAQAGEHGRAFSVVADEIKDLADKVIASTKEIGSLIRAVQDEVGNAVGAIERGAHSVESGVNLSAEAGIALEQITTAARESGQRIGEIVTAVREQSKAAAHVVTLMEKVRGGAERIRSAGGEQARGNEVVLRSASAMREVSQQVSGATEEQARGAHRMRETIENVRGAVEQINHSLQTQSSACEQIAQLLERVNERTKSNDRSAGRMREAMRGLLQQAEGLREGVRHFRV